MIEITTFTKHGGPLTKRIYIGADGKPVSDGSACVMVSGTAERTKFTYLQEAADHIDGLRSDQAIGLGRLRADLADKVEITTKAKLTNGSTSKLISRTREFIDYAPGEPALLLIDVDTKGMPTEVRDRIKASLGVTSALASVVPALGTCACVVRPSTSTGLSNSITGEKYPGSEGLHIYVLVADGADIPRALQAWHDRMWLAGFGWSMVGKGGAILERSLVDRTVSSPERLVFEGAPVLDPPLVQDIASRTPRVREGGPLMAAAIGALADLSPVELEKLRRLKDAERARLKPDQAKARQAWIEARVEILVKTHNIAPAVARKVAERATDGGVLLPAFELDFDLLEFLGCTVGDVLADPERFIGATLADPHEGREYGRGKAMIMQRADGSLMIHSYAHGRAIYDLKYDAAGLRAVLDALPDDQVIAQFVRLTRRMADIDGMIVIRIRHELQKRLKDNLDIGKLEFRALEKAARDAEDDEDARRRVEERQRQRIKAGDFRPQIPVPADNTPYRDVLPELDSLLIAANEAAPEGEPVMRDLEGTLAAALVRQVDDMHLLTADTANAEPGAAELEPPKHVLLTKRTVIETAKLIERHVDYITPKEGISVRLPIPFIHAYRQEREDSPLAIVTSVAAMPIILPDGTLLSGRHHDHSRRILFRVPDDLERVLPRPEDCTPDTVAEALAFLVNEWLIDVPCSYTDKLKLIALVMTILERSILPARPGYFITAGRRGNGKTTALMMASIAALGELVSASAWSFVEEERRKSLLAYMGAAVALIAWDNIPRGRMIACPHIDRALTSHTYTDRVLGFTENRTVPSFSVHAWTGNNTGPKGDTSSRSLISRLGATRPDPENRSFVHDDPLAWTFAHRGKILRAIYTIMRGNPRLTGIDTSARQTRFKLWYHLIGAALEHAAIWHRDRFAPHDNNCPPEAIAFKDQFLRSDTNDEDDHALAVVLRMLRGKWHGGNFSAAQLADWLGASGDVQAYDFRHEFLPALDAATNMAPPSGNQYSSLSLSFRLRCIHDAPTTVGADILCLRYDADHEGGTYKVEELHP